MYVFSCPVFKALRRVQKLAPVGKRFCGAGRVRDTVPSCGYNGSYCAYPLLPKRATAGLVKRLGLVLLVVLIAAGFYRSTLNEETATGSLTLPGPAPNVGEAAESFEARRQDGGSFVLSDEGVYVLTFWSVFNRDSVVARPQLAELAREYGDDGVSFAAVYIGGTPRDVSDLPYTVLLDGRGELTSLYNVTRVPRSFLIEDGEVKLVQNGFLPGSEGVLGSEQQMEDELTRILEERAEKADESDEKKRRA